MYRIFTSLAAFCCCLAFAQTSIAQITFSIIPTQQQANVEVGDTVTINMDVENFYEIASYQLTVGWDETAIKFESIHNLNNIPALSLGNFGAAPSATDNGFFTTLWPAPGGVVFSLFDGDTTIFSFDMIILNTAGLTTPIEILMAPPNPPTPFEVIGNDENGMLADLTGSSIANNGTATELPPGGTACDFAAGYGQSLTSGSGATGDEVCLTVSACGFTDIVSTQYSINFDPALVQFANTENYNLPALNAGSFNGNNTAGFITFSWLDSLGTGTTVADETPIYDICFTLIGAGGSTDNIIFTNSPLTIEITDVTSMGAHIGFDSEPGTIEITGTSSSAVTVVASEVEGPVGGETCIQISALNWDSIIAAQYSMHWDTSIIQFASLGNFSGELSGTDFNAAPNFTDAGTLIFGYADDMVPSDGSTVNNGDVLYEVCFDIVGEIGEESPFTFDGTPTIIEATQIINGVDETVPLLTQDGSATVVSGGNPGELVLDIQETEVCPGENICVDVVASNFELYGWQFTVDYDPAVLDYTGFGSDVPQISSGLQMNETADGNVLSIWVGNGTENIVFLTDTVIFYLCFDAIGMNSESSTVVFDQSSTMEFGDLDGSVPVTLLDGNIEITDCGTPTPTADITHVACFGDDTGAININNSAPGYTYSWMTVPNDPNTEDQTDLVAGTYNVTVTDTNTGLTATASFMVNQPTAALSLSLAKTDALCDNGVNGTATTTVTGGTVAGTYTYLWDNDNETTASISGLSAGEVCVTVTDDNGCTINDCITIGEGDAIDISINVNNSACDVNTGILTATATGGSGTYDTYVWNTTPVQTTAMVTDLAPGNYCVTVTDSNGCTTDSCAIVETLDPPTGSTTMTETTCSTTADGSITVNATGGTGTYSYFWAPGETNSTYSPVPAGSYSCTVTDLAGCSSVISGEVMAGAGISVSIIDSETSCSNTNDGTLTAMTSNGSGNYTYAWFPSGSIDMIATDLEPGAHTVTVTDANGCSDIETGMIAAPSPVEGDASVTSNYNGEDISCFGGSDGTITVDAQGGAGNHGYLWSNGAETADVSGLGADEYTVTITDDNGCTATASVTLTQPEPLTLVLAVTDEITGGDGSVTSTVGGGEAPYEYLWTLGGATSEDINGLVAGEYCLTVTDQNDCTISACTTVNGLSALEVSLLSMTPESCFGENDGELEVTHNGDAPYTYVWEGTTDTTVNPTGLSAGTYSVTVTDANGTSGVESALVVGGPSQDITYTVDKINVNCNGDATGTISLDISGGNGTPYTVAWNSGGSGVMITDLSEGSYTPTITDNNGCTKVGTPIEITEPASMAITLVSTVDAGCNGEPEGAIEISVAGGTEPYDYQWFDPLPIANVNSPNLTLQPVGAYSVIVTDFNGCQATTGQITIELAGSPEITIVNQTDVTCAGDMDAVIDIFVSGGSGNYSYNWDSGATTQDLSNLPGGVYSVTVTDTDSGCTDTAGPITILEPTIIVLSENSITPATVANNDGGIVMNTPTGGVGGYTYAWSVGGAMTQNISGLAAGTYTLTVTDMNGCTASIDVIVPGTFAISAFDITDVSCAGAADGAIDITLFGGVLCPGAADFEYIWNTTPSGTISQDLTNLTEGNYCVTVTDCDGLTATDCYDVVGPGLLQINDFNVINETGNGCNGSIEITVDGGTEPYNYLWSNGQNSQNLTMLCKGNYTVTIVDANGCMLISPPIAVLPTPMSVVNTTVTPTLCFGGSTGGQACISVFGGCGPYNFTINGGMMQSSTNGQGVCFDNLAAGTYVLTVSDSDGSTNTPNIVETIVVTEPDPIVVTLTSSNPNTGGADCNGTININVTGGTVSGSYIYEWSHGPTPPSQDVDMLCNANSPYSVTVTDDNGCFTVFDNIIINDAPFITADVNNISCFDDCDGSIVTAVSFGIAPYTYLWTDLEISFARADLCPGDYSVTVTDAIGITSVKTYTVFGPTTALIVGTVDTELALGDTPTGSIDIDPTGGWGGYSYLWSNGATSEDIGGLLGDMFYTVTVTDIGGCQVIHTQFVNKIEIVISSSEIEDEDCSGYENGFICIETMGGVLPHSYAWNVDGVGNEPCIYGIGGGTFIVTVTDATGNLSREFVFEMLGKEKVTVDITTTAGTAIAVASGGTPDYTYQWNDDAMTIGDTLTAPTGKYQVVVTDANFCTVSGEAMITETLGGDCAEVRTILSPNGDNSNETFEISCARLLSVDLEIFNRWGQKVYEMVDYDNEWRGTDNDGNPLPGDGYFYILKFTDPEDGSDRQVKGYVTIIREE